MRTITNLAYDGEVSQPDDRRVLNVTLPETSNGCCIFFIHGGGWYAGSKEQWNSVMSYFSERGYVCASAGYRLAPEYRFPLQFRDVRLAYSFVKSHAHEWGFDPRRMATWGSSAGGHLAALLATVPASDELGVSPQLADRETRPAAAVCLCPVTSLLPGARPVQDSETVLFGGSPAENIGLAQLGSPIERVDDQTPPFLIVVGDADDLTPLDHQEAMMRVLETHEVPAELVVLPGVEHGYGYGVESEAQKETLKCAERFLKKHL